MITVLSIADRLLPGLLDQYSSGEYGMGTMANELTLGCDCLGQIHYLVRDSCARMAVGLR